MFQDSQKYSQKGLLEILFSDVRKNSSYDKSWVFSKGKKWHRCGAADPGGSGPKLSFRLFEKLITSYISHLFNVRLCSTAPECSLLNQKVASSPPFFSRKFFVFGITFSSSLGK